MTKVDLKTPARCAWCNGTGIVPATGVVCRTCRGSGIARPVDKDADEASDEERRDWAAEDKHDLKKEGGWDP